MSSSPTAGDRRYTKHGFPKGFRFVPKQQELFTILAYKIHGRRLHPKVAGIFHELDILAHHPEQLHDQFECDKEDRFIYFFSRRQFQFQKQAGGGGGGPAVHKKRQRGGQDEDDNEPRPVRLANGGGWKPSGGGQVLYWPKDKGGFVAGRMVTMVFYDHHEGEQVKSQWGMHEFTIPMDLRLLTKPTKTTRWYELALYRLYRLKSDDMEGNDGAGSNQTLANIAAADGHFSAGQPSFGIFTGRNQPLAAGAGASTSRMPPPPQLQQHRIQPNVGHPQSYHHHQYAFGAAPAYGTGMPGRQLVPMASGLPGRQSLQFARPLVPPQMPVPPAAASPASRHQAPAETTATHGGAGQEASHSGATRSLPSAPVSTTPPDAESPSAEEMAPVTATHGGGAGQEAGGDSGAARSSLAAGSRPAERDATATAEAGLADCVIKPEEESVPPPQIEDDDNNDGIGMEWFLDLGMDEDTDLGMSEDTFQFTMEELCPGFDVPSPTQQGDNN